MKEQNSNKIRLGAFVLIATAFFVIGLYYIGSKRNIFHSTINVSASFNDIGGLMPGNNVRFNGINVGTVSKVYPIADTAIKVEFTIDEKSTTFIFQDALASIGTDGLLGNKLINISPGTGKPVPVREGDVLKVVNPIHMDDELRTLTITNDNLKVISSNLRDVTDKFNSDNSLWKLLTDPELTENVKSSIVKFKLTGANTAVITGDLSRMVKDIKSGKGTIGALLTDTTISERLNQTIIHIQSASDSIAYVSGNFKSFSDKLNNGKGAVATLLTDTTFVHNLNQSMQNIKEGAGGFNENMKALKYSWPFKKYYRLQSKNAGKK